MSRSPPQSSAESARYRIDHAGLATYVARWSLAPDGPAFATRAASLLPARRDGEPVLLKVAHETDEREGRHLMLWWAGDGAARVIAHDDTALLLERATGTGSLAAMAKSGADPGATAILVHAIDRLHWPRAAPWPELVPLDLWFRDLELAPGRFGSRFDAPAALARALLADQHEVRPLHGDIHHDNVLDFGQARGWLAIDPKRLVGDRAFDYCNLFCNPDRTVATDPEIFTRRLALVCELSGLARERLLAWLIAWCGLSATWFLGDRDEASAAVDFAVMGLAERARAG